MRDKKLAIMRRTLPAIIFLLVGVAYSKSQPEITQSDIRKPIKTEERGTDNAALTVKILPDTDSEKKAEMEEAVRKEELEDSKRTTFSNELLVIVTTLLAAFTAGLWWSTRKLVIDARDTSKNELRAYVRVQAIEILDFAPNSRVRVNYKLTNVGRTPAKNVKSMCGIHVSLYPIGHDFQMTPVENEFTSEGVLFVDDDYVANGHSAEPLTENNIELIKSGDTVRLYIACRVTYQDIFDIPHVTEYLASVGGPSFAIAHDRSGQEGKSDIRFEYAPYGNKIT